MMKPVWWNISSFFCYIRSLHAFHDFTLLNVRITSVDTTTLITNTSLLSKWLYWCLVLGFSQILLLIKQMLKATPNFHHSGNDDLAVSVLNEWFPVIYFVCFLARIDQNEGLWGFGLCSVWALNREGNRSQDNVLSKCHLLFNLRWYSEIRTRIVSNRYSEARTAKALQQLCYTNNLANCTAKCPPRILPS